MKGKIAGLIAGVILGSVTTAGAASQWMKLGMGVGCQTGASGFQGVTCIKTDAKGYGVSISRDIVMVYDLDNHRRVFGRAQR